MNDTTTQVQQEATVAVAGDQTKPAKKKASWLRTILWMLSMVVLLNIVMALIAYMLHRMQVF